MSELQKRSRVGETAEASAAKDTIAQQKSLVEVARETCVAHMTGNDASHDYSHAFRVAATAHDLALSEAAAEAAAAAGGSDSGSGEGAVVDAVVVQLAALLHDVPDHKYAESPEAAQAKLDLT